jgi:signal transduction histidine kinase
MAVPLQPSNAPWWQRQLLPSAVLERPEDGDASRDLFVDAGLVLGAVALGGATLATSWGDRAAWVWWLDLGLGSMACAALWRRRRHPVAVAVFALAVTTISVLAGFAALIALFNAAVRAPARALGGVFALSLVSNLIFPLLYPGDELGGYWGAALLCILVMTIVIGWGLFARTRRELVVTLHERAQRVEAEQRLRVEQARDAERRRIAREMHDVLAHRLSLLSVHAGALEFRRDATAEEVAEAAAVIRASGQAALRELRNVISVLREDGDEDRPQPPQPTLAQIPVLLEESRAAGMKIGWHSDKGGSERVPAVVGRTAYRVVQEGLTNARKHAPGAAVDITVEHGPPLVLEIVSGGPTGTVHDEPPGGGTGLIGLAERVELAGGQLKHGTSSGAFVLRASLPWTP